MQPIPNKDISLEYWIDKLESTQILSLLDLWNGKTKFEDLPELIDYLKKTFKKSNTIKQYYDMFIEQETEKSNFYNNTVTSKPFNKRSRSTSNCGGSQCEFRFNGCSHSP